MSWLRDAVPIFLCPCPAICDTRPDNTNHDMVIFLIYLLQKSRHILNNVHPLPSLICFSFTLSQNYNKEHAIVTLNNISKSSSNERKCKKNRQWPSLIFFQLIKLMIKLIIIELILIKFINKMINLFLNFKYD